MSELDLHFEDLEESTNDNIEIHLIIENYLQSESACTLQETSAAIHAMLPKNMPASPEVWSFNETCICIAERIPYHHPLQLKLVELLDYIKLSPHLCSIFEARDMKRKRMSHAGRLLERIKSSARLRTIMEIEDTKRCPEPTGQFIRHSQLGESMRDNLYGPDPEHPGRFVNFHCFAANLCERRIVCCDPTWAIWALSEAHEVICKEEGQWRQLIRDELMMGAAQWILWYGQSLFKQVIFPGANDPERITHSWSPGELYQGEGGLARWQFWKKGFATLAARSGEEKEGYGEECVRIAAKAAKIMESLEESMTF